MIAGKGLSALKPGGNQLNENKPTNMNMKVLCTMVVLLGACIWVIASGELRKG